MSWLITPVIKSVEGIPWDQIPANLRWTPAQITTALWLDAADASTVTTVSGAVSQWNDKSGNSRHCSQSNASLRPAYTSGAVNGRNAIEFSVASAAGHFLDGLSASPLTLATRSCFLVMQETTAVNNAGLLVLAPYSGDDYSQTTAVAYETSNNLYSFAVAGSSGTSYASTIVGSRPSQLGIYSEVFSGTSGTTYFSGSIGTTDSSFTSFSSLSSRGYLIGARYLGGAVATTNKLRGRICEIIYTSTAVDTAIRQRIEGYLAHKWGLTANLPSNHPCKVKPPAP